MSTYTTYISIKTINSEEKPAAALWGWFWLTGHQSEKQTASQTWWFLHSYQRSLNTGQNTADDILPGSGEALQLQLSFDQWSEHIQSQQDCRDTAGMIIPFSDLLLARYLGVTWFDASGFCVSHWWWPPVPELILVNVKNRMCRKAFPVKYKNTQLAF